MVAPSLRRCQEEHLSPAQNKPEPEPWGAHEIGHGVQVDISKATPRTISPVQVDDSLGCVGLLRHGLPWRGGSRPRRLRRRGPRGTYPEAARDHSLSEHMDTPDVSTLTPMECPCGH